VVCHRGVSPSAASFAGVRVAAASAPSRRCTQSAVTASSPSLYVLAASCLIVECPSTSDTTLSDMRAATWWVASVLRSAYGARSLPVSGCFSFGRRDGMNSRRTSRGRCLGEAEHLRQSNGGTPWRSRSRWTVQCRVTPCTLSPHCQRAIPCHYLHGMAIREAPSRVNSHGRVTGAGGRVDRRCFLWHHFRNRLEGGSYSPAIGSSLLA
jgi:hypothetical protein